MPKDILQVGPLQRGRIRRGRRVSSIHPRIEAELSFDNDRWIYTSEQNWRRETGQPLPTFAAGADVKPTIGEVHLHITARRPLRADREHVANDEHPDNQFRVNRWPTSAGIVGPSSVHTHASRTAAISWKGPPPHRQNERNQSPIIFIAPRGAKKCYCPLLRRPPGSRTNHKS